MKKELRNKLLFATPLVAGGAILGGTPVFAEETEIPVVTQEPTVETNQAQTEAAMYEQAVTDASAVVDQAAADVNQAQNDVSQTENQYNQAVENVNQMQTVVDQTVDQVTEPVQSATDQAESEMNSAQVEYDKKVDQVEQGNKEANQAQKEFDQKDADAIKAEHTAEEYKKNPVTQDHVDQAVTDANLAQDEAQKADNKVSDEKSNLEDLKEELKNENLNLSEKQNDADAANKNLTDHNGKVQNAEEEIKNAESNVSDKQTTLNDLNQKGKAIEKEIKNFEQTLSNLNEQLKEANQKVEEAEKALKDAQNNASDEQKKIAEAIKTAQNALAEAKANAESAKKALNAAETKVKDHSAQNQALESAKNELSKTQSDLESAQKTYDELKNNFVELNENSETSLGFFEYVNSNKAINFLKNIAPLYDQGHMQIGNKKDATDLDKMKNSLEFMKHTNEIRKLHNLPDLKVSDYNMANAQVNADVSAFTMFHTMHGIDNLAWGSSTNASLTKDQMGSPFYQWYTQEKIEYDKYLSQGMTPEEIAEKSHTGELPTVVGHYLALIDPDDASMGFAYSEYGSYGTCFSHIFSWDGNNSPNFVTEHDTLFTLEEYTARFMDYYNKVQNTKKAGLSGSAYAQKLKEAENVLNAAKTKRDEAQSAYNKALASSASKEEIAQAKADLETAKANYNSANQRVDAAQSALDQATSKTDSYTQKIKDLSNKVDQANQTVAGISNNIKSTNASIESSKQAKVDHAVKVQNAEVDLNNAKKAHESAIANHQSLKNKLSDFQKALDEANQKVKDQNNKLNSIAKAIADKESFIETLKSDAKSKWETHKEKKAYAESLAELLANPEKFEQEAKNLRDEANKALEVLNQKKAVHEGLKKELASLGEVVKEKTDAYVRATDFFDKVVDLINGKPVVINHDEAKSVLGSDAYNTFAKALADYTNKLNELESAKKDSGIKKEALVKAQEILKSALLAHENALNDLNKAKAALDAYIASIEDEAVIIETGKKMDDIRKPNIIKIEKASTSEKVKPFIQESVHTSEETNAYVYIGGMLVTGLVAAEILRRKRRFFFR